MSKKYLLLACLLVVSITSFGCSGTLEVKEEGVSLSTYQEAKENFDQSDLSKFLIIDKSFGQVYLIGRFQSVNYLSLIKEGEEESTRILVSKEIYEKYQVGDYIKYYVDEVYPGYLLDETGELNEIID